MSMIKIENLTFSYPTSYDNVFENVSFLQFTVLSGRHSVLERPLSAAKRPLILTDCR